MALMLHILRNRLGAMFAFSCMLFRWHLFRRELLFFLFFLWCYVLLILFCYFRLLLLLLERIALFLAAHERKRKASRGCQDQRFATGDDAAGREQEIAGKHDRQADRADRDRFGIAGEDRRVHADIGVLQFEHALHRLTHFRGDRPDTFHDDADSLREQQAGAGHSRTNAQRTGNAHFGDKAEDRADEEREECRVAEKAELVRKIAEVHIDLVEARDVVEHPVKGNEQNARKRIVRVTDGNTVELKIFLIMRRRPVADLQRNRIIDDCEDQNENRIAGEDIHGDKRQKNCKQVEEVDVHGFRPLELEQDEVHSQTDRIQEYEERQGDAGAERRSSALGWFSGLPGFVMVGLIFLVLGLVFRAGISTTIRSAIYVSAGILAITTVTIRPQRFQPHIRRKRAFFLQDLRSADGPASP